MQIEALYDEDTHTLTYVLHSTTSPSCLIIDPVWDFNQASGKLAERSVGRLLDFLESHKLTPLMCLETHAHADHLSSSQILKNHYPKLEIAISSRITQVQEVFAKFYNLDIATDGSQFDRLLKDDESIQVGPWNIKNIPTPGHTPACSSYLIEDALFTGDALFMPDYGVGRCDFPGGDASQLFDSVNQNLYTLPDSTRVFTGHDYQPGGRDLRFESTIGENKKNNVYIKAVTKKADFVARRNKRDKELAAPVLLLPSVQVNIKAGELPPAESNGSRYLKLPIR